MEFEHKFWAEGYADIESVLNYFVAIQNDPYNMNYNVIKGFHLFLMLFLNKYGLDYHYTGRNKFRGLINDKYSTLKIKKGLYEFLVKNKLKREAKWIIEDLALSK
jgi:hypothetical protein